jgi:colicin import membrane protein
LTQSTTYQTEFAPPPEPARGRSFALAAAAHVLLFVALGLVTRWTTQPQVVSAEAELWSAVPEQAAPRLVEPDPTPPPEPRPEPVKPEPPKPGPRTAPEPEVDKRDAEIALKKQKEEEKKKALDQEKAEKLRKEKLEKEKAEKEKAEKEKKLKEQKAKEDKAREEKEREKKKAAEADKRKAEEAKAKAEAARADALRAENLKRMQGLAGASGAENSTGTALKSSGPSASYAGRLVARIKPNITYPGDVVGNPRAEVEVRVGADGTIQSRRIVQSSGNKAWDEAVLRAIDKTEVLPRDTDGRVPPVIVLGFRPLD